MTRRASGQVSDPRGDAPLAHGFTFAGYAVKVDDRYVKEVRFLNPHAGIELTDDETLAAVHFKRDTAEWVARRARGEIAEVFQSDRETLIRWGYECS
jgi:hypothetical protein